MAFVIRGISSLSMALRVHRLGLGERNAGKAGRGTARGERIFSRGISAQWVHTFKPHGPLRYCPGNRVLLLQMGNMLQAFSHVFLVPKLRKILGAILLGTGN